MSRTLAVIAILFALPACSVGARTYRAVTSASCSTSRTAPFVDTALALTGFGIAGVGLSRNVSDDEPGNGSPLLGAGFAGALGFTAAAIAGFTWAADCRRPAQTETTAAR